MKILFIGDLYGDPGVDMIEKYLPELKQTYKPNLVIVNAENAAHGRGINKSIYKKTHVIRCFCDYHGGELDLGGK